MITLKLPPWMTKEVMLRAAERMDPPTAEERDEEIAEARRAEAEIWAGAMRRTLRNIAQVARWKQSGDVRRICIVALDEVDAELARMDARAEEI